VDDRKKIQLQNPAEVATHDFFQTNPGPMKVASGFQIGEMEAKI
jgi:hypothetical protein